MCICVCLYCRGFSLGWDNVQKDVHAKHVTKEHGNRFLLMSQSYAVHHRTPSLQLDDVIVNKAADIPPSTFLPSPKDWDDVRKRMEVIVQRILVDNIPALQEVKATVIQHIAHDHSAEMTERSVIINLGAIDANPASTAGVIDVMTHLHQYVPAGAQEQSVRKVICNGDQLSVERMTHSKRGRIRGPGPRQRLEGLVETPQEFHKEGIMLQVFRFNVLLCYNDVIVCIIIVHR